MRVELSRSEALARAPRKDDADPFGSDPSRHPALIVRAAKPFNAETPAELITGSMLRRRVCASRDAVLPRRVVVVCQRRPADSFVTPNDLFYVRNHLPVPVVDAKGYALTVEGPAGTKSLSLSVDSLRASFPLHSITAVVHCGGNRRSEMNPIKPVKGEALVVLCATRRC